MSALVARWGDRVNPILVKEVRAALRGRWFKVTFVIVLTLAVLVSIGYLTFAFAADGSLSGSTFFRIVYVCAGIGINMLAPFSAMLSMTAESDENTLELLQLSGASGWSIVSGKLVSAMIQAMLIASAFLPFLTFAFLLQGVDVGSILALVISSLAGCAAQCSIGILLGSLARTRWVRVVLMLLFGLFLMQSSQIGVIFVAASAMSGGAMPGMGPFSGAMGIYLVVLAALTFTFLASAAARMAHREENRSTPLRATTTLLVLLGSALAFTADTSEVATTILMTTMIAAAVPMWLFASEREDLPRAVAADLPWWVRRFPFLAPWLPGGGLGAVYVLVHLAILVGVRWIIPSYVSTLSYSSGGTGLGSYAASSSRDHGDVGVLLTLAINLVTFLLLVPGCLSFLRHPVYQPIIVRFATVGFLVVGNLLPVIVAYFLDDRSLAKYCPIAMSGFVGDGYLPDNGVQVLVLLGLALLTTCVNAPRVHQAFVGLARARARARPVGSVAHAPTGS